MKLKVNVNPNPFSTKLELTVHGQFTVNTVVRLINAGGTVIRVKAFTIHKGDNKITIENLNRYATGHYVLEVKLLTGDLLQTIKLIKS